MGNRVRMRHLALGMSRQDVAHWAGISFQQIRKYEKGANRISASWLHQLSGVLDVSVSFFFEDLPSPRGGSKKRREPPSPDHITGLLTKAEGHALAHAFLRIKRSDIRHAIMRVAETIADEQGS